MKKKAITGSLVILSAIFIGGCGGLNDDDTPEACQFEVSQALDKGNYEHVIQKLSSDPTCGGAYSEEDGKIQLAAAYIGEAGFDIPTLINDIILSSASNDDNGDSYSLFVQAIAKKASGDALISLEKAKNLYEDIYKNEGIDCTNKNALTNAPDVVKDACFYSGLVDTAKATTSVSLLIGGDEIEPEEIAEAVNKWVNKEGLDCKEDANQNNILDSADASACALKYSLSLSDDDNTNDSLPYDCDENIQVNSKTRLTFNKNGNEYEFKLLNISVNPSGKCSNEDAKKFKRLIYDISLDQSSSLYTTAITSGFCDTSFNTCNPETNGNCYPCPVITETKDEDTGDSKEVPLSTVDTIIETINEGTDAILAVAPEDTDETTLEESIVEFKKDLCSSEPTACLCDTDGDGEANEDCSEDNLDNATDIKIKSPTENPKVQELIADYLQQQ